MTSRWDLVASRQWLSRSEGRFHFWTRWVKTARQVPSTRINVTTRDCDCLVKQAPHQKDSRWQRRLDWLEAGATPWGPCLPAQRTRSPSQRISFAQVRKRGRPAEAKFSLAGLAVFASWGSTVVVPGGQALAVLAQSCDSTGALKPRRRGRFCGACNRTAALYHSSPLAYWLTGLPAVGYPGRIVAPGVGGMSKSGLGSPPLRLFQAGVDHTSSLGIAALI